MTYSAEEVRAWHHARPSSGTWLDGAPLRSSTETLIIQPCPQCGLFLARISAQLRDGRDIQVADECVGHWFSTGPKGSGYEDQCDYIVALEEGAA